MSVVKPIVLIVDDDGSFRRSTERLVRSAGHQTQTFASAAEFLQCKRPDTPACLVLDMCMPGLSGLDLQKELAKAGIQIPVIFITGHGDIPMSVKAMKAGAVEFLTKPFREKDLLDAIAQALERDYAAREELARATIVRKHYETLTPREREVMTRVVAGMLNKQVAADLGTSEKTIKFHRAHIMQKMRVESVADLVRMAARLEALGLLMMTSLS
jgi:FixJ family two-component response regulator